MKVSRSLTLPSMFDIEIIVYPIYRDVKTIHLKRNSYDYDVIERRKHHFVRKIIHDMVRV